MIRRIAWGALASLGGLALVAPRAAPDPVGSVSSPAITTDARVHGADGGWPGWRPLPGAPDGCLVDVPAGGPASVEPVVWIPCTDGTPGCKEMQADWRSDGGTARFGGWNAASHDRSGEPRWLRFERQRGPSVYEDVVIEVKGSAPLAAWRYDMRSGCSVLAALGESQISAVSHWQKQNGMIEGTPGALMQPVETPRPLPASLSTALVSAVAASDSTVALELGRLRRVVRARSGSDSYSNASKSDLQVSTPIVAGDNVFVWSEHGAEGWAQEYRLDPDGALVPFRARAKRHVAAMATDGVTMFWTESFGGEDSSWWQPSLEVWAAPYTSDPGRLAATAHKLTELRGGAKKYVPLLSIAFGGLYAFQVDDSAIHVVRGSDSAERAVSPGATRRFHIPLVVTANELWAIMMPSAGGGNSALERIALGDW